MKSGSFLNGVSGASARTGMTLIELLVVIAVIGFISALLFPSFRSSREAGRLGASKHFASGLDNALGGSPWAWYDFFECANTTVSDRSVNSINLDLQGSPSWDPENPYSGENNNCSMSFDGTSRYLQAPNGLPGMSSSFTISVWVKPGHDTNPIGILGTRFPSGGADSSYSLELKNGSTIHSEIGYGTGWINQNADASLSYLTDRWYHIAEVVKPDHYTIYANGNVVGEGDLSSASGVPYFMGGNRRFRVGTIGSTDYFNGKITALHIFPAALASGDIQKMYAAEKGAFVADR